MRLRRTEEVEVSCGTRRHETRPGYVHLLTVRDGAGAQDPRLDPQAVSELQSTLFRKAKPRSDSTRGDQEDFSRAWGRVATQGLVDWLP